MRRLSLAPDSTIQDLLNEIPDRPGNLKLTHYSGGNMKSGSGKVLYSDEGSNSAVGASMGKLSDMEIGHGDIIELVEVKPAVAASDEHEHVPQWQGQGQGQGPIPLPPSSSSLSSSPLSSLVSSKVGKRAAEPSPPPAVVSRNTGIQSDEELARQLYESELESANSTGSPQVRRADERTTERLVGNHPTDLPSAGLMDLDGLSALEQFISARWQGSDLGNDHDSFVQMAASRNREISAMLNMDDVTTTSSSRVAARADCARRGSVGERFSRGSGSSTSEESLDRMIPGRPPQSQSLMALAAAGAGSEATAMGGSSEDEELARAIAASLSGDHLASEPANSGGSGALQQMEEMEGDNDVELQSALLRALDEQNYVNTATAPSRSTEHPPSVAAAQASSSSGDTDVLLSDALTAIEDNLTDGPRNQQGGNAADDDAYAAAVALSMNENHIQEEAELQAAIAGASSEEDLIAKAIRASLESK